MTNAKVAAQAEIDPNPLNNSDAALVNAAAAADLRVTKAVSNPAPGVGALIAYTVEVTNLGPSAATNATILDVLPANVSYVSSSASQGTYDTGTGVWTVGALDVTATETLTLLVRVTASGAATNTATRQASAPVDPNPANDSGSATATPALIADLAIAKALMTAPIPGLPATYTIVVHNGGPSAVAGATVTDTFPPALLGVSWTCTADPGLDVHTVRHREPGGDDRPGAAGSGDVHRERHDRLGRHRRPDQHGDRRGPGRRDGPGHHEQCRHEHGHPHADRGHAGHEDRADTGDARHEHHLHDHGDERRAVGRDRRRAERRDASRPDAGVRQR